MSVEPWRGVREVTERRGGWRGQVQGPVAFVVAGNDRVQSRWSPGEDGDQLFSFTVGDPGSLSGGITCRQETDRRQVK